MFNSPFLLIYIFHLSEKLKEKNKTSSGPLHILLLVEASFLSFMFKLVFSLFSSLDAFL
jgi:hypothetical protein